MTVGRNELCPCGSGKKYKHCCLKKEHSRQLKEERREQFYEDKQALVEKIGDYLVQQVPIKQYNTLKDAFKERTEKRIDKDIEESYFTFWLYFFYRFDNGLRGIEWFYNENQRKLTPEECAMTERWMQMQLQFLKAIDVTEETVVFQNVRTKEQFPVSKDEENLINFYPWVCTVAFLEPFDGLYYFNGLRYNVSPYQLEQVIQTFEGWKEDAPQEEQIWQSYFPELIAQLLEPVSIDRGNAEIKEYSLVYHLHNSVVVSDFLRSQRDIRVELWEAEKQEFTWAGNWRVYQDNACPGHVTLADSYGSLYLQNDTLIYVGIEAAHQQKMKARLEPLKEFMTLEKEEDKLIDDAVPQPNSTLVVLEEMVPEHFAFYAQNDLMKEMDAPIPMYNHKSLRGLVAEEQTKALTWLENIEYNMDRQARHQFEEVEVTADFNTVRRELGLSLSPFVTGGSHRTSVYESIEVADESNQLYEADIPFLEAIGFTPDTAERFYTTALLRYYKEKTSVQTEAEATLTTAALYDFRALLEQSQTVDWQPEAVAFWKTLLLDDFTTLPEYTTENHRKFLHEMDCFFAWMIKWKALDFSKVRALIKE